MDSPFKYPPVDPNAAPWNGMTRDAAGSLLKVYELYMFPLGEYGELPKDLAPVKELVSGLHPNLTLEVILKTEPTKLFKQARQNFIILADAYLKRVSKLRKEKQEARRVLKMFARADKQEGGLVHIITEMAEKGTHDRVINETFLKEMYHTEIVQKYGLYGSIALWIMKKIGTQSQFLDDKWEKIRNSDHIKFTKFLRQHVQETFNKRKLELESNEQLESELNNAIVSLENINLTQQDDKKGEDLYGVADSWKDPNLSESQQRELYLKSLKDVADGRHDSDVDSGQEEFNSTDKNFIDDDDQEPDDAQEPTEYNIYIPSPSASDSDEEVVLNLEDPGPDPDYKDVPPEQWKTGTLRYEKRRAAQSKFFNMRDQRNDPNFDPYGLLDDSAKPASSSKKKTPEEQRAAAEARRKEAKRQKEARTNFRDTFLNPKGTKNQKLKACIVCGELTDTTVVLATKEIHLCAAH